MTWALVTGGARGLGAVIADALAKAGHQVLVHYRTSRPASPHRCLQGDFSTPEGIECFIESLRASYPLSVLVNNVGFYESAQLADATSLIWDRLWRSNVLAPALLGRAFASQKRPGAIVHVGVAGLDAHRIIRRAPLYSVLKQALWALTRAQAQEWAPYQIRVNMVSPGQLEESIELEPMGSVRPESLPMGRVGTFDEVADVVLGLLTHSYVTGQNIEVAGGYAL